MSSPIALFDSGLGGLTLLNALRSEFVHENFIYLGDTARLPYGSKSPDTIRAYLLQNIQFLKKFNPKAIVVACNSASSVLTEQDSNHIPVLGVIKAGSEKAIEVSQNKSIAVIGTKATIKSNAYTHQLIDLDPDLNLYAVECPLFVPFVEEGLEDDPLTNLVVFRYLNHLQQTDVDTLILGCTHYPILRNSIQKVMGSHVELVDATSKLGEYLKKNIPLNTSGGQSLRLLCTDHSEEFEKLAYKVLENTPFEISKVDL